MSETMDLKVGAPSGPVSIVRCTGYEMEEVRAAVREALGPLGGMAAFVKPGERIGLKPNLLLGCDPDKAVTTHPAVVAAVALEVIEAGGSPIVVESPGSGILPSAKVLERLYRKVGYREVADRCGFSISLETEWEGTPIPDGRTIKRVEVIKSALQVDGIINLPKFKTHAFMVFTGATKNVFGVIPGLTKVGYHGKFPKRDAFAGMLLDVASLVRPRVCCGIAGFDTGAIPVLAAARNQGLWGGRVADLPVFGPAVADLVLTDFQAPAKGVASNGLDAPFVGGIGRVLLRSGFSSRPRPQVGPCTICGSCEQACPGQAITMDKKARVARVDDDKCIRCYCCHEVCPNAAIELRFTGTGRMMHRFGLV